MDAIFKALNDPARRTLLDSLRSRDGQTLTELEAQLDMTRFGVMKHLGVLEDANLVVTRRSGRFKYHYLNAVPLQEVIDRWIEPLLAKPTARAVLDLKTRLENQMTKPDLVQQIFIRCSQDVLWDALTDAGHAAAYDFLGQNVTRRGKALHYAMPDGTETLVATELEAEPKSRLVTTFEPKWDDTPASRVVYLIEPEGAFCRLTVEHHGLTHSAEPGSGTYDGWVRTLSALKTYLETGEPAHIVPEKIEM